MKNNKFDYGNYRIEYRNDKNGPLRFLNEKVMEVEKAMKEADKLKNAGYHDVTIRQNK